MFAAAIKASASFASTTTAMRSWLSEMASSVPSRPSYFLGTASKSMERPVRQLANGHRDAACAEIVAALYHQRGLFGAEQALQLALYGRVALLHFGAACFQALQLVRFGRIPWRRRSHRGPVRPPRRITTSPGAGCSRRTFSSGTAPSTAPISMRFAT